MKNGVGKNKLVHDVLLKLAKLLNLVLVVLPFAWVWRDFYHQEMIDPYHGMGNYAILLVFLGLYYFYVKTYDGFMVKIAKISDLIYSQFLAVVITDVILYAISWLLVRHFPVIWPMLITIVVQLFFISVWSYGIHKWYFATYPARKTIIIYDSKEITEEMFSDYGLEARFNIVESISIDDWVNNEKIPNGTEVIFLANIHSHERNQIIKKAVAKGIQVFMLPRIGDVIMSGARRIHMLHLPVMELHRYAPKREYLFVKRMFDILVSGIALIILAPLMIFVSIIIKLTDHGPVFYKQVRLTQNGREFGVLKFRSMRTDAEKDGVARLSTGAKDPRVTPIGRFMRKVRIDELPQLINILKGDMTIVGPRPERPEIAKQYEETLPEFGLRLQAKAGLTGYAQVYGKYNTTPYNKLEMDLMYIANPSILEDLKIMFATVKILFIPESTEGIAEGQTTAKKK